MCGAFIVPSGLDEDMDGTDDAFDPMIEAEVDDTENIKDDYFSIDNNAAVEKEGTKVGTRSYSIESLRLASGNVAKVSLGMDTEVDFDKRIVFNEVGDSVGSSVGVMNSVKSEPYVRQEQEDVSVRNGVAGAAVLAGTVLLATKVALTIRTALVKSRSRNT